MGKWDEDGSWFPSSVAVRDVVTLEGFATKYNFGSLKFEESVLVGLDPLVVPGQD